MSYVHIDDKSGRLTEFRERLSIEVQQQIGEAFPIFQDTKDIKLGQKWRERIDNSLDEVTFFIPIITPSFFNSPYCRQELALFLKREKKLKRSDLVIPVYYIKSNLMDEESRRVNDKLAEEIAARQYADWKELRFEPFTSPVIERALARLATDISDALEQSNKSSASVKAVKTKAAPAKRQKSKSSKARPPARKNRVSPIPGIEDKSETSIPTQGSLSKTTQPTRIVDPSSELHHKNITEAIKAAKAGDRIIVRPGVYKEGLIIDKPLEVIGEGELGQVVVQATGEHTLQFNTSMGRVANLTLQQLGGKDCYGVDIAQGRLDLEGCDITCRSLSCVAIHDGATPQLRRNVIHDGKHNGVFVFRNGQGTLEENDIHSNGYSGVQISSSSNIILRSNRIHGHKGGGVFIQNNSKAVLEDNDIFGNAFSGVTITTKSNPILRRNRIHDGKSAGVLVSDNGQGTLENNDIVGNVQAGVEIRASSNPTLRRNRINNNGVVAVWIFNGSAGTIEDNDLRGNAEGAWDISEDSEPNVKRARNQVDNGATGV